MSISPLIFRATVAVFTFAMSVAAQQGAANFEPPPPTGRYPIGTTTWVVTDRSQAETFAAGRQREVRVVAWYPSVAVKDGRVAPYLREGPEEIRAYGRLQRIAGTIEGFQGVFGHGVVDALPANEASFPLLVFSHGYRAVPSAYTLLLEDLASQGYIVLSIIHPFEATATALADGTVVTPVNERGELLPGVEDVLREWAAEDVVLGRVTATADRETQLRILRPYLASMPKTNAALKRWVADTKAVLDQLKSLPADSPPGRVGVKSDLTRLGVFGHAFGGIVAGQFCVEDSRCRAGMNLDGSPQYGTMIDKPLTRPFVMVYSDRDGRTKSSATVYERSAATYYRVEVDDTLLSDFTDMPLWRGPLRAQGIFGPIAPQVAVDITRRIAREFFDQELRSRPSSLLAGKQKWAWEQVSVEVHRPARK